MNKLFKIIISVSLLHCLDMYAGYSRPNFIDGCRSINGQFEVTVRQTQRGEKGTGTHKWNFIWKDLKNNEVKEFEAKGVGGGKVSGQLFIAPDGETFALWNHITLWWKEKSHDHVRKFIIQPDKALTEEYRRQPVFSKRIIIYSKNGEIIKELGLDDILTEEDWKTVPTPYFNRVEWLRPYNNFYFKT